MKRRNLLLASALALALGACGPNETADDEAAAPDTMATDTMADAGATATDAALPTTAQGFVNAAAASDTFEVESSRLAATMAKDSGVKSFAQMMIDDHTKSTADLKAAAAKATPAVSVDLQMTAEQKADLERLKTAGDNFDRTYAQTQVAGHEKALALLQSYAQGGDSAPLQEFASKTAPVVSGHLDRARKLPQ